MYQADPVVWLLRFSTRHILSQSIGLLLGYVLYCKSNQYCYSLNLKSHIHLLFKPIVFCFLYYKTLYLIYFINNIIHFSCMRDILRFVHTRKLYFTRTLPDGNMNFHGLTNLHISLGPSLNVLTQNSRLYSFPIWLIVICILDVNRYVT